MAHKNWCGQPCNECIDVCKDDLLLPCSMDCEFLSADGRRLADECKKCSANLSINKDYDDIEEEEASKCNSSSN